MINKKILLYIFILATFIYLMLNIILNKNIYKEENKIITGKIVNIKSYDDKMVIDVKSKLKYRITTYDKVTYKLGDVIIINGVFKTPSNNTVFNLFNYRKYLLSKKIKYISVNPTTKLVCKNNNLLYKIRNNIVKHINKYKSKDYIKTFIMGDTSNIEKEELENYRNIGISHLLAISGMHVSLFLIILNFIFKRFKYKKIIIHLFLMFLLFITNYPDSLVRCALFFFLKDINNLFKINYNNIEILLFTASFLIIFNPYIIYSIGFIFSVTITFFILLSNNLIKDKTYFKKLIILSIVCFLSSIPILSYTSFKINFITPFINIIFIPIISTIIFPLGIITFIFNVFDNVFHIITNGMEVFINVLSSINCFTFGLSKTNVFIVFLYYLLLFISIKINKKYIILFLIVLIININSRYLVLNTKVTFLNVGQGDSSVIILPKETTIMIDTGGIYNSSYSIVLNKTIPYLNSMGINKIDLLILSHGDYDHMGEAITLVNNFKVNKVIFNCDPYNDLEKELIKALDKKHIKYYSCINELNIDNSKLYFLQAKEYDNENDNSNVIYTEINGYKFMFMGDAGVDKENDILDKYNISDIDVLKVGHHGSKTSSSEEFINEINPNYSIISVGKNNRYGHPNKEVLNTLEDSKIYRTDKDGSIMFKIKNNKLKIETCVP